MCLGVGEDESRRGILARGTGARELDQRRRNVDAGTTSRGAESARDSERCRAGPATNVEHVPCAALRAFSREHVFYRKEGGIKHCLFFDPGKAGAAIPQL
jgi:hypothetical protein